jgi:hypothetical protein
MLAEHEVKFFAFHVKAADREHTYQTSRLTIEHGSSTLKPSNWQQVEDAMTSHYP